ncbi:MAG: DNA-processing protein DprA [Kiritimatiellae bacterium]|nr:DNA-processing protein DprA [Kiritimatiellia bacterium]
MNMMSEDAKAILLLCGHLGGEGGEEPLNQSEYNRVVRWLLSKTLRPSDLLIPEHVPFLAQEAGLNEARLTALLRRGVLLGFAVERWNQSGIWVICRSDSTYPKRYRDHLKDKAPPILFGTGDRTLLQGGGLAIVGSRDVDADGEAFARDVAERCAREGLPVVSGGARGVDQIAMSAALEAGGIVLGVLADTLLRRSVERNTRHALADRRLLLISPYHPEAGFNVGNAMGRNKLIYGLADFGLVVSADNNKGGTWEGAIEELKREQNLPLFIRSGPKVPKGNLELLRKGGRIFPPEGLRSSLRDAIAKALREGTSLVNNVEIQPELPVMATQASVPAQGVPQAAIAFSAALPACVKESPTTPPLANEEAVGSVLDAVTPLIMRALESPLNVDKLAQALNVRKVQMQDWVTTLLADGVLVEQVNRRTKVLAVRKPEEELKLG